jgi:hypothetical protein
MVRLCQFIQVLSDDSECDIKNEACSRWLIDRIIWYAFTSLQIEGNAQRVVTVVEAPFPMVTLDTKNGPKRFRGKVDYLIMTLKPGPSSSKPDSESLCN